MALYKNSTDTWSKGDTQSLKILLIGKKIIKGRTADGVLESYSYQDYDDLYGPFLKLIEIAAILQDSIMYTK